MRIRADSKKSLPGHFSAHFLIDYDTGLYVQDFFQERLYLERRRTERSGKPFLLMILNLDRILKARGRDVLRPVAHDLLTCTREIDLKGWYRSGSSIGVIFTEMEQTGEAARNGILRKLSSRFSMTLGPEDSGLLDITLHVYPEEKKKDGIQIDPALYPGLIRNRARTIPLAVKRMLDIIGSAAGLALTFPLFLVIAAAIKADSKGPVLFRQERIGRFGRRFVFLKFRSMYAGSNAEAHRSYIRKFIRGTLESQDDAAPRIYKLTEDSRVTPVGRLLRRTSLDELPQLINVLTGDMSLVGPRPPIPYECADYDLWHRERILEMKPGITGLWQVKGRSRTDFNSMVRLDIRYARDWSLWMDIRIVLATPGAVLSGKGAY